MVHQTSKHPRPGHTVWTSGKHKRAMRLLKGGKSVAKVADEMGVDKRWLKMVTGGGQT